MRSQQDARRAIDRYSDLVLRLCMVHLKNAADTEDVFQNVFLKYVLSSVVFENEEHEKAWMIRVTINACKDWLRVLSRRRTTSLEALPSCCAAVEEGHSDVLEAVLSLPAKYRKVVYLHYYEGYTAAEVGELLGIKTNTVYTLLTRSKKMLQKTLGGDADA